MIRRLTIFIWLLSYTFLTWGQHTIKGEVKEGGGAIPGATIRLLDTDFATVSDNDGQFRIEGVSRG